MEIENAGTGPALIVNQTGTEPIVDFRDDGQSAFFIADGGNVGIGTTTPDKELVVNGNASLNGYLSADSVKFNIGAGILDPDQGELSWDEDDQTLHFGMNGVTSRISQNEFIRIKADVTIKKGQAVRATGASGDGSGNITGALYSASSASGIDEIYFIGVAAEDMGPNDFGFVSTFGKVKEVEVSDTRGSDDPEYGLTAQNGWAIGTILYVSTTEPGKYTQTQPLAPNRDIPCVIIVSTNGTKRGFFVRYEHGYSLNDIHDVRYDLPLVDGDLLTWNNNISAWTNKSETDPIFSTWAQANSANYDSVYTTVNTNSAGWDGGTLNYQRWFFTGDGTNDTFNIAGMVENDEEGYRVYVNNVVVDPNEYQIIPATNSIAFDTTPISGAEILIIGQYASQIITLSATGDFVEDFGYTQAGSLTGTRPSGSFTRTNPKLDSIYTTTNINSASWNAAYTSTNSNSAKWESVYTTTNTNSATNWNNTEGKSAYTTTQSNSASWNQFCPTGSVLTYAGSAAPNGWLLCDGSAVSRSTYAGLFAVVGSIYGNGDGSTTFNLPDLRGRVAAGKDDMDNSVGTGGGTAGRLTNSGTGNSGIDGTLLGAASGSDRHTLTINQMPAHTHDQWDPAAFAASSVVAGGSRREIAATSNTDTGSTGGGAAHPIVQPTIVLNMIIRT
jgi:microcystin-dependent protein